MKLTLKHHLNRQTLIIVAIAYSVSMAILIIGEALQGQININNALSMMVKSVPAQINTLIPTYLLPEEMSGQVLLLEKFKSDESLTSIRILPPHEKVPSAEWDGSCKLQNKYLVCHRSLPSQVAIFAPITETNQHFGTLLKVHEVGGYFPQRSFAPLAVTLALALLIIILGLIWSVTRVTSREIPAAMDILIAEVGRALHGKPKNQGIVFPFDEFRRLAEVIDELIRTAQHAKRDATIARTTQMLAHDVKKPFSILSIGLNLLSNVKDMDDLKRTLAQIIPELDRAVTAVNGMINDVMEIGRTAPPRREVVSAESLIKASLNEVSMIYKDADISFTYDFGHRQRLSVDPTKVSRVFSNIFGNAMQAMKGKGRIWVKTTQVMDMITFRLGNTGSSIDAEDLPHLFEAFFTKNKKGGTGLGLAIAEKAIHAHGGKIWCESSGQTVEFFFTLPTCGDVSPPMTTGLPHSTKAIMESYKKALPGGSESVPAIRASGQ